ncbi:MAG: hypothetical protein CL681_14275 [Blastopirellula sp.]|nr:hypothetical protein [Blastopirellula sp.]
MPAMRITQIKAFQPPTPGSPPDWRTQLGQMVVEITTSDGLTGIGVGGGGLAGIHVIETVLRDLLIGEDASQVESLHEAMCRHTAFYGRSGLVVMAISGVDLALWDLRGKAADTTVAQILNPAVDLAASLPTYRTVFDDAETEEALASGFRAVKLHVERFGDDPDVTGIERLVARVRDKLGSSGSLMIDAFAKWNVESTLAVARAIAPYQVDWLEEPLLPDDLSGYQRLMQESPVPIAGGEHEYLANGFRRLMDDRLHAVVQPDINWCGGMTTLVEIYRMAKELGVRVVPHRGAEGYAVHAIAALDQQPLAESPRTWFQCLSGFPALHSGTVRVPTGAGFGLAFADA